MPSRGGLIFHFACLVYMPNLGKLYDLKVTIIRLMGHVFGNKQS